MAPNRQFDHVNALVSERHAAVRIAFDQLLDAIARNSPEKVQTKNRELTQRLSSLGDVIAKEHWPSWLTNLLNSCANYRDNHSNGIATWKDHLNSILNSKHDVEGHTWFFDESDPVAFNVDEIIHRAREQHSIDALFDRVLETLRALAVCEELDSIKACRDLEDVVSALKKARAGSFTAQIMSWKFARKFTLNVIAQYVKESSLTGPLVKAFEETAKELDVSIEDARRQIADDLISAAKAHFRSDAAEALMSVDVEQLSDLRDSAPR